MALKPGDKVYRIEHKKCVVAATIGTKPLEQGFHLGIAHIDARALTCARCRCMRTRTSATSAPTITAACASTSGWPSRWRCTAPSAARTAAAWTSTSARSPAIGLLHHRPAAHLAAKQNEKKLPEGITGENLNVLIASTPIEDKEMADRVKLNVLAILNEAYGITERDFTRAEIEVVPAFTARDVGLDRAMIGAYGHDDRVDAYPALMAEIRTEHPAHTTVCVLTDKEEVGSDGVTGMNGEYAYAFLKELCAAFGADPIAAFRASRCLSADVTAAYDPSFAEAFEPNNGTYAGRGIAIYKYTGSRGKSSTNDAPAELVSYLTRLLDKNSVAWQIGEMGKIDLGGGGTIAKYVANRGIDTIDIGVPVLSMHSPFEVVSKADVYMAYLAFKSFCEDAE